MKTIWILFTIIMIALISFGIRKLINKKDVKIELTSAKPKKPEQQPDKTVFSQLKSNTGKTEKNPATQVYKSNLHVNALRDSLVNFALQQKGRPYKTAGTNLSGFDCSGFVHYIFAKYGIAVPHSSELLAKEGMPVSVNEAQKGDVVIFTGTQPSDRTPGHVGIVISNPHEPIKFVHSSSNGGVKVSTVDSTGYKPRFLQIRRLL